MSGVGGVDPDHVCPDCGERGHIGDDCERAHRAKRRQAPIPMPSVEAIKRMSPAEQAALARRVLAECRRAGILRAGTEGECDR